MSAKKHGPGEKGKKTRKRMTSKDTSKTASEQTKIDKTYQNGLKNLDTEKIIKKMDDRKLLESIGYERKKLNEIAQKALEDDGNLDVESVREQNRVVESLINEALLRRLEDIEQQEE